MNDNCIYIELAFNNLYEKGLNELIVNKVTVYDYIFDIMGEILKERIVIRLNMNEYTNVLLE